MKYLFLGLFYIFIILPNVFSQHDKGKFVTYEPGFYYNVIMRDLTGLTIDKQSTNPQKQFKLDFENKNYPTEISDYTYFYHSIPVLQGRSGTCWAYAATSFMESETYLRSDITVKLSEIFTVYWEYIERAKYFVDTKGETFIGEGSETNAILRVMQSYGLMPFSAYSGLKNEKNYNDHSNLFEEYSRFLSEVKESNNWDEEFVIMNVKEILDNYIGTPPLEFIYEGVTYTPESFMDEYLKLNPGDYFSFMSTKYYPYNEKHELVENDNWWHCDDYYNLGLDDYMYLLNKAIITGNTVSICGDISEPGYDPIAEVAVVPDFDIPAEYINEDSRQLRLSNRSTTDDHCIHIVGYQKVEDEYWYIIKDSGSGAFDGKNKGYRFYHEDYIKLKVMNYMIHVDIAREILDKIIK